jgi:hypothetical protein
MPTTWNPNDKGTLITLRNNNLTAILGGLDRSVRSTTYKITGKWYYECIASWAETDRLVGIMLSTALLSDVPGRDSSGYGVNFFSQWQILFNNSTTNFGGTTVDGDTIGICLDLDNNFLYATKNGSNLVGNPVAGTGGTAVAAGLWYAAVGGSGGTNRAMMANFGAMAFAFGPPSGFTAWDTSPFSYVSFESPATSISVVSQGVGT